MNNNVDWVDAAVDVTSALLDERNKSPYDGVLGSPPDWVPDWAISFFKGYRNRLLDVRGYTSEEVLSLIDTQDKVSEDAEFHWPVTYPNGQKADPFCFHDEVRFLAWLRWCVNLGPSKGLEILGGGFAPTGQKFRSGGSSKKGKEYEPKSSIRRICDEIGSCKFDIVLDALCSGKYCDSFDAQIGIDIQEINEDAQRIDYRLIDPPYTEKQMSYKTLKNILSDIKRSG